MDALMDIVWYVAFAIGILAIAAVVLLFSAIEFPGGLLDRGRARLDEQFRQGTTHPHVGKLARVQEVIDSGHLWVEVEGEVWPARLPPFTPTPPNGDMVRIIKVVSKVLIVQPDLPEAPAAPVESR